MAVVALPQIAELQFLQGNLLAPFQGNDRVRGFVGLLALFAGFGCLVALVCGFAGLLALVFRGLIRRIRRLPLFLFPFVGLGGLGEVEVDGVIEAECGATAITLPGREVGGCVCHVWLCLSEHFRKTAMVLPGGA